MVVIRRIFNIDPMHRGSNHLHETALVETFHGVVRGVVFGTFQQLQLVHVLARSLHDEIKRLRKRMKTSDLRKRLCGS